jgi:hypothetical protein
MATKQKTEAQLKAQMGRIMSAAQRRTARLMKSASKAAPVAAAAPAAATAAAAAAPVAGRGILAGLRAGVGRMGIPGIVLGTLAYPVLERLIYGSREQQMRDQFELQRKLEMEQMGASGDMGGMAPGMGGGQDTRMYDLVSDFDRSRKDLEFADVRNRALGRVGSPSGTRDLENLFAGQEARIRTIQSPRQMTPYEVMEIIGG